ncbi:hypothetical protein SAMN02799624_02781 [Paenibacillus sp. UNC496MF]|uniref:hypothetical protein n=1 Tax=Paenibacillus sp. UNC496MF TaxID=1502753 RepID=UPI0008F1DABC|nr:hypothetical protein [Paenibacillus sp. UNC496MF]SFI94023.1 hypothetical protein SAMN02799624_02781 [Paenibacillus sp. UNC496MF]
MNRYFAWDDRLGIPLPALRLAWEQYGEAERTSIVTQWEIIRGTIPDRVMAFERVINAKQTELFEEEDFERSCGINADIAELASRINDLHIWYRMNQDIENKRHS